MTLMLQYQDVLPWKCCKCTLHTVRKSHCSYAGLRGWSLFCCLLSQLVMSLLDKSPRHETCSSISVRKAQTAVKVTIETAILKTSTPPLIPYFLYIAATCYASYLSA